MCLGLSTCWTPCLITLLQLLYSPSSQQNNWPQLFNYLWKPCQTCNIHTQACIKGWMYSYQTMSFVSHLVICTMFAWSHFICALNHDSYITLLSFYVLAYDHILYSHAWLLKLLTSACRSQKIPTFKLNLAILLSFIKEEWKWTWICWHETNVHSLKIIYITKKQRAMSIKQGAV